MFLMNKNMCIVCLFGTVWWHREIREIEIFDRVKPAGMKEKYGFILISKWNKFETKSPKKSQLYILPASSTYIRHSTADCPVTLRRATSRTSWTPTDSRPVISACWVRRAYFGRVTLCYHMNMMSFNCGQSVHIYQKNCKQTLILWFVTLVRMRQEQIYH